MSGYLDEMLASLRDMAPVNPAAYPTSQPTETYTDYSQGWPQEMTRPKAQFGDIPAAAPAGPAQIPQMQAQAPLAGLEGTLGANPAPFSLAGPSSPSVSPSLAAAREMTAQPPIQPGGGLPPMPPMPPAPDGGDAGGPTAPPAPTPAGPAAAPAPAPMSISGPAAPQAEEPSFLQKLSSGAKSFAPALLGMGAALQGDQGHLTTSLMNQQQGLAEQQQTQNLTAKALLAKGVDPATVMAAVRQPDLLKALVGEHFGKSKYKIQVVGEDQFGGKTYAAVNENDPTDYKTFVPGKGFVKADAGSGDAGAGGVGDSASGPGYLGPGVTALDPAKTGDDYLSQFSPEAQSAVKSYINGDSQPTSNPRKGWAENIKKIAQKYGGDMGIPVNDQTFYQKKNFLTSLADTKSGVGLQVKGFQQGLEHLSKAADALEGLHNSGGLGFGPLADLINRGYQLNTKQEGQAAKAAGEVQALAGETGKLFSGAAGGGVGERAETRARFNTIKAPPAIAGALEGQLELMMGGLHSLEKRRDEIFGSGTKIKGGDFLGSDEQAQIDKVKAVIARLRGEQPEAAPVGAPVPIASKADYDKLPAGSPYIAPDGSHRVKK